MRGQNNVNQSTTSIKPYQSIGANKLEQEYQSKSGPGKHINTRTAEHAKYYEMPKKITTIDS